MERLPPIPGFARVGLLDKRIRILEDTMTVDPPSGGLIPGPPALLAETFAAIEPAMLSRLQKEAVEGGGAITNVESLHVSFWFVPGVTVNHYIEYDHVDYPVRADSVMRTRRFDILEVRQVYEDNRLIELLCKERVS
jgi:hypothetical protein